MTTLKHMTVLSVGDWSRDGHNMSDDVYIQSNLKKEQIEEAYKIASKKVGFDLTKEVCADYEDNSLSLENVARLQSVGIDANNIADRWEENYTLYSDSFVKLFLELIKVGNPEFKFEIISPPTIRIGGYGLFST